MLCLNIGVVFCPNTQIIRAADERRLYIFVPKNKQRTNIDRLSTAPNCKNIVRFVVVVVVLLVLSRFNFTQHLSGEYRVNFQFYHANAMRTRESNGDYFAMMALEQNESNTSNPFEFMSIAHIIRQKCAPILIPSCFFRLHRSHFMLILLTSMWANVLIWFCRANAPFYFGDWFDPLDTLSDQPKHETRLASNQSTLLSPFSYSKCLQKALKCHHFLNKTSASFNSSPFGRFSSDVFQKPNQISIEPKWCMYRC